MTAKPKISAPDWCFYRDGFVPADYYEHLGRLGVTAAEMVAPERWQVAREKGLFVLNIPGPGMQKGLNQPENHAELLPMLNEAIDKAHDAGIPHLIVFSGNREGQPDSVGIANCAEGFKSIVPHAEAAGVTLLFEMLNSYDHVDYQADHGAYGFELARRVNSPTFAVLYDIYHMFRMGDNVAEDIMSHLDVIKHIHVAESPARTMLTGLAGVDYGQIAKEVQSAGYDGYWGLEFVPGDDVYGEIGRSVDVLNAG